MRTRLLVAGEERKQLPQSLPICRPEGVERGLTVSCGSLIAFSAPQSQILAFIRPETVDHGKTMSPRDREMVMRVTGRPVGSLLSKPPRDAAVDQVCTSAPTEALLAGVLLFPTPQ